MGNLVRRVLAFVLGMVFTVSLAAGSVAGGAYWAYKTVKPLTAVTDKDSGLGDLREQTVEDLVALLQSAAAEPDKYTLARLADEYNIDFVKLLDKVGVKVDADKNKANWNALMGVSLFNLKDGIEPFLKSIPVRALYNFISEEQLDNLLSREAQDKLGDYTVYELISKEEGETDVGAIKAVRTLSIGSLLPQFFEEKYDAATHRSEYVLKDDCKIRVLEVFGNVSLGVISNMLAPGADFMTELLEGSLSSVAEMPIEDIIYDIAATISEDIGKEVKKYAAVLNGAKISQLFTRNADGGYSFTYESVVKDLKIGCIFGLTDELGDGVWTNKNGEPVPDVLQELCNIDLGAIFDNDGTLDMINQLIGGVNVGMILDACKVEVGTPALDMIRKIEIGKLLEGQTDKFDVNKFLQSLVSNVRESVGDVTLSEIIGVTTGNAFVDKLLSFKVSDFVLDEYSVKNILNALKSGFGDVCLGDVLNVTKGEGGEWNITGTAFEKLEFMKPLFDLSINNIINVVDEITSNNGKVTASAIVETIIPELKLGDIFVAIPGISKDEATGNYVITAGNISKVLPSGIGALLDMRVYQIVDGIENNNSQFDLYTILDNVKFGDFVSFADDLLNKGEKEYVYDEKSEKYVWKNDATSSTTKFMNVSVAEMANDAFKNKFEKTLSTPVIAVTEFAAEMGKWVSRVSGLDKTLTEIDSQLDSLCGIVSGIFTPESTLKKATVADDVEAGVIVDGVRIILDTVNSFKTSSGKKIIPNAVYSAIDGVDEIIGNIKLKNFVEEIKTVEVSKVISVAASSVNDATENKYEEKVNAFAGVADTIAGGTLGNFRIRNFLVASAEGSAEQGLAEQIHNILIIYNANNSSVDEMFVQLSEIYGGVRAKEFLDKNKNLEINQSVSAVSSVVKTFFKDDANGTKVKDIIDGGVNVVEVVFRGKTFVKFGVADFDVSELTEKTETLSGLILGSSSQANKTICSVLGEFKTLYNGVKVSKFVEFSKNMPLENVINASTRIAKTAVADYSNGANTDKANDALDDVAALVNCVFEGSTLGKVKVAEDKRVVELTDKVEALTDNFLKDGTAAKNIVAKVYDEIEILYPTSTFKTIVDDSKNMLLANVVNAVTDIVKTALTECKVKNAEKINDCITDFADLVNYTLEGSTLTHINIYADKQIVEFVNKVEAITDNFLKDGSKERTVVAEFYNEVKALYAATTLKTFVADSKNMLIADVVNAATGIVKTALTTYNVKNADKINDCITDFVELVNYTLEGSTLTHINIYADKQIVVFVDKVEAITDNFLKEGSKEKTVVAKVYDEVRILYPTTTLKSFVTDSKNMLLANVTNAVADITTTAVTTYNVKDSAKINDTITDSVDMINYIFEGSTLSKIKVTNDKTVVELTNKTEAITDNFLKEGSKEKTVVAKVYDEVRILYPTTTIKTFVDDSKNMLLVNVTNAVADISKTAVTTYNVKNAATINDTITDSVDMINYIFEGSTLSKIKVTNDKAVVELTNKTEAITDNFLKEGSKEKTVVAKVYDEVRILYPATTLKSFVTDSKNMLLANVTNAVADISKTAVTTYNVKDSAKINDTITDSVDMINYIFEGSTLSKIKVTNDKAVVELTNKTEAITDNFLKEGSKEKTVVAKVYDEVRILYPTTTIKTFVDDSKNMLLANVTNAVADISKTAVTTYNVKNATKINDTITDSVDMINYIFEGSTLSKIKVTNDKAVVELTNKTEAITDNFLKEGSKEKTVVAKVYDEVRILYPATTLKSFVTDSKKLIIADVTVAAGEIVKVSVNKQKASDITDAVNDIVKVVFGTKTITDSKPIVNFEVAKLSNEVKDLADIVITNNKAKTIIDEVAAQFASLYAGVVRSEFVTASGELQIADIVDSVDSIIKTSVTVSGNKDEVKINDGIDDLADLAKTLFGGTVKKPVVYNITVSDAADRAEAITDDIPMNTRLRETIACVYEKVRSLYDGKKLTEVGSASKSLEFNAVVSAVSDLTVTAAKNNVVTDVFDGVKGISSKLFTGTMSSVKIADFFIDELTDEVIAAADKAIGAGVPKDMLDETAAQFAYLFNGTRRSGFVTAAKNVDFGDLLHSVSEIAKKASTNSKYLSAVTDTVALAGELVSGKVTAPKFADFEITGLANAVNAFVTDFVPDGKVKDVISKTIENFGDLYAGGTTRTTFVADSKNLSIGDTITSVKEITDVAGVKLDRVYTLATVAIGGNGEHASTFAKPYFDMNGLWNEANTTEKIVGVGVGAAAGAGMYFLANDTLVKLAKNALGEDKLVGDLVAETLGYTKNESGKWTFEDDENELATTSFELRVCDVLKKGFDFKGTFEEKLNVANVALLGKAVNTKYDKKDNVKDIVNGALDEIVNLFGTADAKNYKEVIKAVKVDDVVDSLAAIAGIPSSGKYADKADHIAALLKEMLAGTLGKPGIESNMFIAPVVRGVKDVALDYIPDGKVKDVVEVTLENFASLYEYDLAGSTEKASYTFKRIKEGTKAIEIKKLIASGSDIVKTASSAVYGKTERWFDIAGQILAGTVSDPEVYIDKAWKDLSNKEKLVVAGVGGTTAFVAYNYFNDKFVSYLEKHYGDRTVGSLIADNLGYAQNAGGEYVLSEYGFVNPMMNEYFAEKIVTVANKTYDYKQPLREYLTVGNLIAASGQTMHVYTKFVPASFKLAQEGGKWTIEGDKYKTVAENVLAIAAFKDGKRLDARVKDDVKAFIGNEILANVRVGELMGKTKDGTGWLESAGVYASGMSSAVYDIDAGKFVKGETTVDDVVNGLTVGDVMTITNESSGLLQRLKPVKVGDLAGRIDNLRLGEAMSYVRVEDGGTVKWYEAEKDAEGNYVIAEADFVAGTTEITDEVVLAIADFTVKELSDGGFADKLMNAVKDITLGKVISVGNNKILKQLENVKIGSISTEINHMSVSKLLGYEKGTDGKWYETDENGNIDNSKEVTGVVTAFVDFTIEDLGSADFGTRIKAKVNDLTLGDIISHDNNPILSALADKKIGNLATEANELKVGVMMGYTYDETADVWYKDAEKTEVVTDDLMRMLAKYQVKDLNSVDFENKVTADIKQLKISKFFGSYESNAGTIFEVLSESEYNNATIDSLPGLMKKSLTDAKLGKLGDLGIVSIDVKNIDMGDGTMVSIRDALNTIFHEEEISGDKWENWNMSDLLTNLIKKALKG